jgi:hypothetical protein
LSNAAISSYELWRISPGAFGRFKSCTSSLSKKYTYNRATSSITGNREVATNSAVETRKSVKTNSEWPEREKLAYGN